MNFQKGFTLVELAIVIVIIGLLVGGVLQGQELIQQAKIRAQIKQFHDYDAAALTLKSKFGFLPGDVPPTNQPANINKCSNGYEGNGRIDYFTGAIPPTAIWCEASNFLLNLKQQGLIKDNIYVIPNSFSVGDRLPEDKLGKGGLTVAQLADGVLYYFMGPTRKNDLTNNSAYTYISENPSVTPAQASILDTKLDDGVSNTGGVKAVISTLATDATLNSCIGASLGTYNFSRGDETLCRLVVKSGAI